MKSKISVQSIVLLIFVLILVYSCKEKSTEVKVIPFTNLSIVLDKATYSPGQKAQLTINNHTDMDLILEPCGPEPGFDFQKQIGGKWNKILTLDCMGENVEPFEIPAGSTFKHELTIPQLLQGSNDGLFRLLLWLKDKKTGEFLDKDDRASDPFRLKD